MCKGSKGHLQKVAEKKEERKEERRERSFRERLDLGGSLLDVREASHALDDDLAIDLLDRISLETSLTESRDVGIDLRDELLAEEGGVHLVAGGGALGAPTTKAILGAGDLVRGGDVLDVEEEVGAAILGKRGDKVVPGGLGLGGPRGDRLGFSVEGDVEELSTVELSQNLDAVLVHVWLLACLRLLLVFVFV